VGWKAVVAAPGKGTAVRSSAPSGDPTGGLRHYPKDMLSSPLAERTATFAVSPGAGTLTAPKAVGGETTTDRSGDGFAGVFADAAAGKGALLLLILAAFAWGAVHALSPGHGKTIITAYLVGQRGTPRHAALLGLIVTVTHTIGVFGLGLVTLALSQFIVPDRLYPWLNLVSGLLVVGIGASVLRARWRHSRQHHHHHHHHGGGDTSFRSLFAVGVSGGLLPCPSALVVLLAAISLHRVAFGLLLILAFSAGLALTITGIGLAAVLARTAFRRVSFEGRLVRLLPAASALVILAAGLAMTLRAVPKVS
jgi:ABC-type nickel/cobalt efflux system permease component RcnA